MASKSPAFQFYPLEFLGDENVTLMSNQEVGCYIKLLGRCWIEKTIPQDLNKMAVLCGESPESMKSIWENLKVCFSAHPDMEGRLINNRLTTERDKQIRNRELRSQLGKSGNEKRWGKDVDTAAGGGEPKQSSLLGDEEIDGIPSDEQGKPGRALHISKIFPEIEDRNFVRSWLVLRKARRSPVTQPVINSFIKQAGIAGVSIEVALQACIDFGWIGFQADWYANKNPQNAPTLMSEDFTISDYVKEQSAKEGRTNLEAHFLAFVSDSKSRAAKYVDWDEALMTAIRKDVGRVGKTSSLAILAKEKARGLDGAISANTPVKTIL